VWIYRTRSEAAFSLALSSFCLIYTPQLISMLIKVITICNYDKDLQVTKIMLILFEAHGQGRVHSLARRQVHNKTKSVVRNCVSPIIDPLRTVQRIIWHHNLHTAKEERWKAKSGASNAHTSVQDRIWGIYAITSEEPHQYLQLHINRHIIKYSQISRYHSFFHKLKERAVLTYFHRFGSSNLGTMENGHH